jgi:hypothetical protein
MPARWNARMTAAGGQRHRLRRTKRQARFTGSRGHSRGASANLVNFEQAFSAINVNMLRHEFLVR